jgi:exopolyphosphatase/guanosine-5'-triphosphate,3'-diphosphate pyrophosphatase
MSAEERRLIARLSGILRIADGLDRTHSQSVSGITVRAIGNRLRLSLQAPADPVVERAEAERKSDLFSKAFGSDVELVWRGSRKRRAGAATPARPRLRVMAAG